MNRDAIMATIIGFAIGLGITAIFLVGPNLKTMLPAQLKLPTIIDVAENKNSETVTPNPPQQITGLAIDSPLPEAVVNTDNILISGSAPTDSTIVIQGDREDIVLTVGNDGKFAGKINLSEGNNEILVTGYAKDGNPTTQMLSVYFTADEI